MKLGKYISLLLAACMIVSALSLFSCNSEEEITPSDNDYEFTGGDDKENNKMTDKNTDKSTEKNTEKSTEKNTEEKVTEKIDRDELLSKTVFYATSYDVGEIVTADRTDAGSLEAWKKEIVKSGKNNDDPTENAVIHSPYHILNVNGTEVPVYTARCTTGAHSFAWIDVASEGDFLLEVELELDVNISKCVVLPESRGGDIVPNGNKVAADIYELGSYTFTFSEDPNAKVTDPTLAPLTLMVTREEPLSVPEGYAVREIAPGYHGNAELEFVDENTVYVIKAGFHNVTSIAVPSNSILYIERGAYIQVTDRLEANGKYNSKTAIHADDVSNASIISRGLLDCGKLQGGDNKYKHVVNTARSNNVLISGLTVINSNTWTICAYSAQNVRIERNLLLAYRTYSDGIMMSECTGGVGRYNFVRTGDDAIEFKGTGWWNGNEKTGVNCLYEYNDLWTDKGAGYCLTWESSRPMRGMFFRNNSVGFAQPTWTSRNTAIDCLLGTNADVCWSDVIFENIEIYHVISPNAINMQVQGEGGQLENIKFKNITVSSAEDGVYAFRMHFSAKGGSISKVTLDNVVFCGKKLTKSDLSNPALFCNEAKKFFKNITVK